MAALANTAGFVTATVLTVLAWFTYLWFNNRLSRTPSSPLREIIGGLLSFALLTAFGIILYFFALPLAMGVLAISVLMMIGYALHKTLRSMLA